MRIRLQEHFTYSKLIRFTLPSIAMMIFTSIYGVVDGLFVSNYVGKTSFAAINLIWPLLMVLGAFGFMIGTGGTAIVARVLGEGEQDKGNRYFSLLVYVTAIGGAAISAAIASPLTPYSSASWRFSRAVRMLRTITDADSPSAATTTSASTAWAAMNRRRLTTR